MGKPKQLEFPRRNWGGRREGAGRKPPIAGAQPQLPHRSREPMKKRAPLHVTMKVARNVYNLRSQRSLRVIRASLLAGAARLGVLVVQTSVQGNHIHFLVEADDTHTLGRAMRALAIRMAKGLNRVMGRQRGRVFADRYHARVLGSPTAVRNCMRYLRENHRRHVGASESLAETYVDPFTSERDLAGVLPSPTLWLLTVGWQRALRPG